MSSHLIDYIVIKLNTMKTEITNLLTGMINAKKSHMIIWAEENGSTTEYHT